MTVVPSTAISATGSPIVSPPWPMQLKWIGLTAALAVLCGVHVWRPVGYVGDLTYLMVTVGAGGLGLLVAVRQPRLERNPYVWIATGVTLSGIADVWYFAINWTTGEFPDASFADAFYIASYVALALGLLGLLGMRGSGRRLDIDGLIDMCSFAILAVMLVSLIPAVGEIFADQSISTTVKLVWAAYPILDATLLAVLVRAMLSRRLNARGLLISAGIASWLASDFAYLLIADASGYSTWMNLGWMLGAAAMAAALLAPRGPGPNRGIGAAPARVGGARLLISLCPLLLPGAIETWAFAHGDLRNPIPLFAATAALILLALARETRMVRARDVQECRLERSERYYQALAENSADAVIVIDATGRIINDAPHLAEMLGKQGAITAGANAVALIEPVEPDVIEAALARMRSTDGVVGTTELRVRHTDGGERWLEVRAVNRAGDSAVGAMIVNIHDVTDRKRVEQELTHRAFHDSLTGLANRALFRDRVAHALQRSVRTGTDVAVVYLDIDGFKSVNDSRGHEAGDDVLREIAARLLSVVRVADTVARLGGDEFAILIEQSLRPLDEAAIIADRILRSLSAPVPLGDQQIVLSASIGISVGDAMSTASSILRDADIAMYQAKSTGKAKWTLFDPEMRAAEVERLELEADLGVALAENQFQLLYQPIIELDGERVVGFEALLRWHHPTRGVILPDRFIPIAEDNGLIIAIGEWVLNEACRTGAAWQLRHPDRQLSIAVNLSGHQITTPGIVGQVRRALEESGLAPMSLVLELTETVLVRDATTASRRLHQLRALGIKLAIDDFGTGYSSLSYLRQFPVDIIKIDRSFISSITDRIQIPAILRGLLDLGKTLNLQTIAEGIELGVQRDMLRDEHCKFGQGFLFAEPLSATCAGQMLDRRVGDELLMSVHP